MLARNVAKRTFWSLKFFLLYFTLCFTVLGLMLLIRPRSKVTTENSHFGLCYDSALNRKQFFLSTSPLETSPFADKPRDQVMSSSHSQQRKIRLLSWTCFWKPSIIKWLTLYLAEADKTIPFTDPACSFQQGSDSKQLADRSSGKELSSALTPFLHLLPNHCLRLLDTEEYRICLAFLVHISLFVGIKH